MKRFRLEEILRLLVMAMVSSLAGTIVLHLHLFPESDAGDPAATSVFSLLTVAVALAVGTPLAFVLGLALHLVARLISLPRLVLLPAFVLVGTGFFWLVVPGAVEAWLPMATIASIVAWVTYSFGPLRLWNYEYDPVFDSDF